MNCIEVTIEASFNENKQEKSFKKVTFKNCQKYLNNIIQIQGISKLPCSNQLLKFVLLIQAAKHK